MIKIWIGFVVTILGIYITLVLADAMLQAMGVK